MITDNICRIRRTTHCFSLRSKGVRKGFFGGKLFFLIKIFNFYQKKQLPSDKFLPAVIANEAQRNEAICLIAKKRLQKFSRLLRSLHLLAMTAFQLWIISVHYSDALTQWVTNMLLIADLYLKMDSSVFYHFFYNWLILNDLFIIYHWLRHFNAIQNLIDNIFRCNIFRFGFIRQADAMPQNVAAHRAHIFGNHIAAPFQKR